MLMAVRMPEPLAEPAILFCHGRFNLYLNDHCIMGEEQLGEGGGAAFYPPLLCLTIKSAAQHTMGTKCKFAHKNVGTRLGVFFNVGH